MNRTPTRIMFANAKVDKSGQALYPRLLKNLYGSTEAARRFLDECVGFGGDWDDEIDGG